MTLYEELQARGLVAQITDNEIIDLIKSDIKQFPVKKQHRMNNAQANRFPPVRQYSANRKISMQTARPIIAKTRRTEFF